MEHLPILKRHELCDKALHLIENAALIDYAEVRPMLTDTWAQVQAKFAKGVHITMDCSTAVTKLYEWCDLPDPNGLDYNGTGYTGTLYDHFPHKYTDAKLSRAGALLVYGSGESNDYVTHHVAMVINGDRSDPLMFSHGSEIGPLAIRKSEEDEYHVGDWARFLDVSGE